MELYTLLLQPLYHAAQLLEKEQQQQQNIQTFAREVERSEKESVRCAAHLEKLYSALKQYAQQNGGKLPELLTDLPLDGKEFICPVNRNSPYIYFPGSPLDGDPDLPLLFDFNRHGRFVNVLLLNGKVLTLEVPGKNSPKRVISILQTRFRYPEKELKTLLKTINHTD